MGTIYRAVVGGPLIVEYNNSVVLVQDNIIIHYILTIACVGDSIAIE